jgi:hypothetical protein
LEEIIKINKHFRTGKGDITSDSTELQNIMRLLWTIYTNSMNNLEVMVLL